VSLLVLKKEKKSNLLENKRKLISALDPKSPITEQYRTIRTNIEFSSVDKELKMIMITSAAPGDGKSTTAANLAVTFAQQGKSVLLVDADLRKPTVHYTFNLNNTLGLTSVLSRQFSIEETVTESMIPGLSIMPSGPIPPNPAELLGSASMDAFMKNALARFDRIVFDTPPVLAVADAQILANKCDGVILVVSSGKTEIETAIKAKEILIASKGKLLGAVLNNKKLTDSNYYYYYGTGPGPA
jgi:capsular exopolysaccharide synthesis family protein